jgi:hypothetical protein
LNNFHHFRLLAISQPESFSSVAEQVTSSVFSLSHVLDLAKMQVQGKASVLANVRPFSKPQMASNKIAVTNSSQSNIPHVNKLITHAFKAIMKIDMAMHLHFTTLDRQQQLEQASQMNWYLQLKHKDKDLIRKRSTKFLQ